MLEPGALLDDRYRLLERIAAGGMGEVWRGTDDLLGRTVAVKLLHRRLVDDAGFGARFRGEARAMAALHHPGVADVYDYGETAVPGDDDRAVYIVMAWVKGQPLSERIAEAGRLDAATTASVVAQTARALQAVHDAGVVHRDVKPANLVVEPDGHVVLIDFGVAVTEDAAPLTAVNEVVGTALYMAPEQISKQKITPATDIYALGAVAYHCLAGHPPFPGDNALTVALQPPRRRAAAAARRRRPRPAGGGGHGDGQGPDPPLPHGRGDGRRGPDRRRHRRHRRDPRRGSAGRPAPTRRPATHRPATRSSARGAVPPDPPADPTRGRAGRRAMVGGVLVGLAVLAAVLIFADPTGIFRGPDGGTQETPTVTPGPTRPGAGDPGGTAGDPVGTRSPGATAPARPGGHRRPWDDRRRDRTDRRAGAHRRARAVRRARSPPGSRSPPAARTSSPSSRPPPRPGR